MSARTDLKMSPSDWKDYQPFRLAANRRSISASIVTEAQKVAENIADHLINRFGAKKVMLFGSLARGEFNRWSDIDLAE